MLPGTFKIRKSLLLFMLLISVALGIAAAYFYSFNTGLILALSCFGLAWQLINKKQSPNILTLVLIAGIGFSIGINRGTAYANHLTTYEDLYFKDGAVLLVALEDGVYNNKKQLAFKAGNIQIEGQNLRGKIDVSGFGVNAIYQGDQLSVEGKLYPGYGASMGRFNFAKLELVERNPSLISVIKRKFIAGMQTALPEPLAPYAMGLLVGQRATLPDQTKEDLMHVGLTHIIAVSGYNLTIILQASKRLLAKQSKRLSLGLSVSLISIFLLVTGFSASIVRAAIVSMLSIALGYYGRRLNPINLILLAMVITAMANPIYLWKDISWYLSFLAFFGVLVIAPILKSRLNWAVLGSIAGGVALESICAEIMTLPYVLFTFGQMSRVGLIANVLVVAFIPLAMLLGLIAGLSGMLASTFCGWFSWPATLLLNYMLDTAHILANLPHVYVTGLSFSLKQMVVSYLLILILVVMIWLKNSRNVKITDKNF